MATKNNMDVDSVVEPDPIQNKNIKLDILINLSSMQNQNGIRLKDYYRYSKFCGKKVHKY